MTLLAVLVVGPVAVAVLLVGRGAARTRRRASLGLVLLAGGVALAVASAWTGGGGLGGEGAEPGTLARTGLALGALAAGLAHAVAMDLVPLPRAARGARRGLGAVGLATGAAWAWAAWTGLDSAEIAGTASGARAWIGPGATVLAWTGLGATAIVWIAVLALARRPSSVLREGRRVPSVRFACPRCGVRADWGEGGAPCPECGLFVHADWTPAPDGTDPTRLAVPAGPRPTDATLALRCPGCGIRAPRPWGRSACAACGAWLRLSWNVHVGSG